MRIFLPFNFYSHVIREVLPKEISEEIRIIPSSLIIKEIEKDKSAAGLIPAIDLIYHKDLFVSQYFGISFEGNLCNSYLYFKEGGEKISNVNFLGDLSSQDVILSKILFKEMYNSDINASIIMNEPPEENKNIVIVGDNNFTKDRFLKGISFSEELIEILNLPYVNYILASNNEETIKQMNENLKNISEAIYNKIESGNFGNNFSEGSKAYIMQNISSLIVNFDDNDIEGIKQLIRLPYFHGIIKDIVEVKLV